MKSALVMELVKPILVGLLSTPGEIDIALDEQDVVQDPEGDHIKSGERYRPGRTSEPNDRYKVVTTAAQRFARYAFGLAEVVAEEARFSDPSARKNLVLAYLDEREEFNKKLRAEVEDSNSHAAGTCEGALEVIGQIREFIQGV